MKTAGLFLLAIIGMVTGGTVGLLVQSLGVEERSSVTPVAPTNSVHWKLRFADYSANDFVVQVNTAESNTNYLTINASNQPFLKFGNGGYIIRVTDAQWSLITNNHSIYLVTSNHQIKFYGKIQ